jgi:hypothetical protein
MDHGRDIQRNGRLNSRREISEETTQKRRINGDRKENNLFHNQNNTQRVKNSIK